MKDNENSNNSWSNFFATLWDILFNWIASIGTLFFGVIGIFFEDKLPQGVNIKQVFFSMGVLFVAFCWKFTKDTRKKLETAHTKIDDLIANNATADNFFITRKKTYEDEKFDFIVESKPKIIHYSGGNLNNLIIDMMDSECFKRYIIDNSNVKVKFLFPDPDNENVINNLVDNITCGNRKETYISNIRTAVATLSDFIKDNSLESRVEYRFYQFVPSFGLKVIAGGNDERLYVDLYTIKVEKENRYRFKIEEKNSRDSYLSFAKQYNELWNISKTKEQTAEKKINKTIL